MVQYEVKAGIALHTELVHAFAAIGYSSYRLVPGLDALVPVADGTPLDPYLLNLFSCKADRARVLADRGLLLMADGSPAPSQLPGDSQLKDLSLNIARYHWSHTITRLPYGTALTGLWTETVAQGEIGDITQALIFHAISQDAELALSERYAALNPSLGLLQSLCQREPSYLRLATLASLAADAGARQVAVDSLRQLAVAISVQQRADPCEPFLVPGHRFEQIPPRDEGIGNWIFGAVLEELERTESYSSFYSGSSALPRLELIQKLGYGSEEM